MQPITVKLRLRDKHAAELNRQARAVNFVWNYCNEAQRQCSEYGTVHRRHANSAKNILRIGLDTLVGGAHV